MNDIVRETTAKLVQQSVKLTEELVNDNEKLKNQINSINDLNIKLKVYEDEIRRLQCLVEQAVGLRGLPVGEDNIEKYVKSQINWNL